MSYTCHWKQPYTCRQEGSTCCSLFDDWARDELGRRMTESANYTPNMIKDVADNRLLRNAAWCCLKGGTCGKTRLTCHYPTAKTEDKLCNTQRASEVALLIVLILVIAVATVIICVCYWQKKTVKKKLNVLTEENEANGEKKQQLNDLHKIFNRSAGGVRVGGGIDPNNRSQKIVIPIQTQDLQALRQMQASQHLSNQAQLAVHHGMSKRSERRRSTTFLDDPQSDSVLPKVAPNGPPSAPNLAAASIDTAEPQTPTLTTTPPSPLQAVHAAESTGHHDQMPPTTTPEPAAQQANKEEDNNGDAVTLDDMPVPQKVDLDDI